MRRYAIAVTLILAFAGPLLSDESPAKGGSLLLRVFSDDRVPLADAQVEAILAPSSNSRLAPRQPAIVLGRATTDEKGWVTLEKLSDTAVVLHILPKGRKQPYITDPIEVRARERLVLDDLVVPSPSELVIHLDVSESVREHLGTGRIDSITVEAGSPNAKGRRVETKETTITLDEVFAGKWNVRTMMTIGPKKYHVDPPEGVNVEVPRGTRIDTTIAVHGFVFAGKVTLAGEPFRGQMNVMPSEPKPGNWGFAIPFDDDGRFVMAGSMRCCSRARFITWRSTRRWITPLRRLRF